VDNSTFMEDSFFSSVVPSRLVAAAVWDEDAVECAAVEDCPPLWLPQAASKLASPANSETWIIVLIIALSWRAQAPPRHHFRIKSFELMAKTDSSLPIRLEAKSSRVPANTTSMCFIFTPLQLPRWFDYVLNWSRGVGSGACLFNPMNHARSFFIRLGPFQGCHAPRQPAGLCQHPELSSTPAVLMWPVFPLTQMLHSWACMCDFLRLSGCFCFNAFQPLHVDPHARCSIAAKLAPRV
jgi:hypothetical protein